jgi:hypothetical protein
MAPSDQIKDSHDQAEHQGDSSNHDGKTERGQNDKVGPDGKTEGERLSDQTIHQMERELGTKMESRIGGGGSSDRTAPPPPTPRGEPLVLSPAVPPERFEFPALERGGVEGGGGGANVEYEQAAADHAPDDGGAYSLSLSEAERAASESRAAGDAMFKKFVKGASLRGEQQANS